MSTRHASHALRPLPGVLWAVLCWWALAASAAPGGADAILPPPGPYDLWPIGQSRWSMGVVTEPRSLPPWAYGPDSRSVVATNLVLGMNLGPTSGARLVWYAPLAQPRANTLATDTLGASGSALDPNGVPLPTPLRVGLVLTPSDPWSNLRQGAFTKVELSGNMALSLRSRSGGVWLALSSRW